jgi:hypothetical protein
MKKIFSTFILILILNYQNTKIDIYFLYENDFQRIKEKKTIFIEGQTFQVKINNGKYELEKYTRYKNKITTLNEFYKKYNIKNFDDLIKYNFYIFVPINKEFGKIYKIEHSLVITKPIE